MEDREGTYNWRHLLFSLKSCEFMHDPYSCHTPFLSSLNCSLKIRKACLLSNPAARMFSGTLSFQLQDAPTVSTVPVGYCSQNSPLESTAGLVSTCVHEREFLHMDKLVQKTTNYWHEDRLLVLKDTLTVSLCMPLRHPLVYFPGHRPALMYHKNKGRDYCLWLK